MSQKLYLLLITTITLVSCVNKKGTRDTYYDNAVVTHPQDSVVVVQYESSSSVVINQYKSDSSVILRELVVVDADQISPSNNYRLIGRWRIYNDYNIIIWTEDNSFLYSTEFDHFLNSPICQMYHFIDDHGRDSFGFVNPDEGFETYSISEWGDLYATYPGANDGKYFERI